jgi:hypothetical protein
VLQLAADDAPVVNLADEEHAAILFESRRRARRICDHPGGSEAIFAKFRLSPLCEMSWA